MRHWVRRVSLGVAAAAAIFAYSSTLFPSQVSAAINPQINFQGKLTNPNGTNVANGNYSIVFSMYAVDSGGSAIWTETQGTVSVTDGVFQVALGSVTPLPGSVDFDNSSIYLGVKVGADAEMTPRVRFTASPYAFNADKLDGLHAASFGQLSANNAFTGSNTIQTATNSDNAFRVSNTAGDTIFNVNTNTNTAAFLGSGGLQFGANATFTSLAGSLYISSGADNLQFLSLTGNTSFSVANSTNAFAVSGNGFTGLKVDTTNSRVTVGASTGTSTLNVAGSATIGTGTGTATLTSWNGNNAFWIDMPTTGPSGIGSGGPGVNAWIAYAQGAGNYFTDSAAGDIVYRNTGGKLLFGTTAGLSNLSVASTNIQIGQGTTDAVAVLLTLDSYNNATDPAGTNGATYYNTSLNKFRCYEGSVWKNCITKELSTRSFTDTTADTIVDNDTTSYWDLTAGNNNSYPNLTPSATTKSIWVNVSVTMNATAVSETDFSGKVERTIGGAGPAACNSGTLVGNYGLFTSNTNVKKTASLQFIDEVATTSKVWYNVCSDLDTVGTTGTLNPIDVTLFEVENSIL